MIKILHLLRSEPDETVETMIEAISNQGGATVVPLYPDHVSGSAIDWKRLMEDIFSHDKVISWW